MHYPNIKLSPADLSPTEENFRDSSMLPKNSGSKVPYSYRQDVVLPRLQILESRFMHQLGQGFCVVFLGNRNRTVTNSTSDRPAEVYK